MRATAALAALACASAVRVQRQLRTPERFAAANAARVAHHRSHAAAAAARSRGALTYTAPVDPVIPNTDLYDFEYLGERARWRRSAAPRRAHAQ
jgi:hypothetical protein